MLKIIFTVDYEIHGNGDGSPRALMVEPTSRLLDVLDEYGAKLTIMADVAEILKFREYRDQVGRDDYHYEAIVAQLQDAISREHDVQLHLHCSYFNARLESGKWVQDQSEYNFAGLSEERLNEVLQIGKEFLEEQLRLIDLSYCCNVFRAANWAVSPSRNVVRALVNNGLQIDTSVFKYGQRRGIVNFDYTDAFSNIVPWRVAEDDICRRDDRGSLVEVPIYTEARWVGAFVTIQRLYRLWMSYQHRLTNGTCGSTKSDSVGRGRGLRGDSFFRFFTRRQAWKADFNQCGGRQLVRALERAEVNYGCDRIDLPFVLIGHSKLFTRQNERSIRPFLALVAREPHRFGFARFRDLELAKFESI